MTKKRQNLVFLGLCFILVFSVYGQTLFGHFVFDDRSIVEFRPLFENINNLPKIIVLPYWTEEAGLYRPLTLISYSLNYIIFGQEPWSFHLVNLILYALTGYLLFLLIKKLFQRKLLAYLTPLLFLVLPIHTEAVANIVGRAEILALFFSLLAFLAIIGEKTNPWKAGLWFLLALASKETALAVLPIALLIIFYPVRKPLPQGSGYLKDKIYGAGGLKPPAEYLSNGVYKDFLRAKPGRMPEVILRGKGGSRAFASLPPKLPKYQKYFSSLLILITSAAVYLTVRFLVLGQYFLSHQASLVENPLKFASFFQRIATALKILVLYLKKTFWPFPLCSDYSYNQIPISNNFFNLETLFGLAILLFFIFSLIIFLGRAPVLAFGSGFFLFSFLPVSNLLFPIGTIAGERLIYFPSVGLCLYLVQGLIFLGRLKPKKFFRLMAIVLSFSLLCFYAGRSFIRNFDWLTEKQLFISAAQCAPKSVLSRSNLATVYYFEGKYDQAEKEILAAFDIYDKYSKAVNNLGLVYWKKGQYHKAKEQYFKALKIWPPYEGVYENLALLYLSQGQEKQARKWLKIFFAGDEDAVERYFKAD